MIFNETLLMCALVVRAFVRMDNTEERKIK